MNRKWYYTEAGAQYGPVSESELIRMIQSGDLPPGTPVCRRGDKEWAPARERPCFQVEIFPRKKRGPGSGSKAPDLSIDPELEQELIRLAERTPKPQSKSASSSASSAKPADNPFQIPDDQTSSGITQVAGQPPSLGQALGSPQVFSTDTLPLSAFEEAWVRKRHCGLIGVALLFGAICPIILKNPFSGEYTFIFTLFGQEGMESSVVIGQWFVLIAGAVILGLLGQGHDSYRGGVMTGLAGLNIILGFAVDDTFKKLLEAGGESAVGAAFGLGLVVGWWGLVAGGRTRYLRPRSETARMVGMIGGIVMLGLLVMPILPEEAGTILIILPFKAIGVGKDATTLGLLMLGLMAIIIASAIMCINNNNLKTPERSSRLGQNAFQLASLLVPVVFMVMIILVATGRGELPPLWEIINMFKVFCVFAGAIFLMPMGISECIIRCRSLNP